MFFQWRHLLVAVASLAACTSRIEVTSSTKANQRSEVKDPSAGGDSPSSTDNRFDPTSALVTEFTFENLTVAVSPQTFSKAVHISLTADSAAALGILPLGSVKRLMVTDPALGTQISRNEMAADFACVIQLTSAEIALAKKAKLAVAIVSRSATTSETTSYLIPADKLLLEAPTDGAGKVSFVLRETGASISLVDLGSDSELTQISFAESQLSLSKGSVWQFAVSGLRRDGLSVDVSSQVTWISDAPSVVSISSSGVAKAMAAVGSAKITASVGLLSADSTVTAASAALLSITVTPSLGSVAHGLTQQFVATGTYTDESTADLSSTVSWQSTDPSKLAINASGLGTSTAVGTTSVVASLGVVSGSASFTVSPAQLVSLAITPDAPSVAKGLAQPMTATGTYTDGHTADLSASVAWASSATSQATISSSGLASAVAVGSSTISATLGTISDTTLLTIGVASLATIAVTPANPTVAKGLTQQFAATGTYSDGSTGDVSGSVSWQSLNLARATVSGSGLATAGAVGSASISATLGSVTGTTTLTVDPPLLVSIAVSPTVPVVIKGQTQPMTATGTYSDGSTSNISNSATWQSSQTSKATVDSSGLGTAVGVGTSTVSATLSLISGSTVLTVMPENPTWMGGKVGPVVAWGSGGLSSSTTKGVMSAYGTPLVVGTSFYLLERDLRRVSRYDLASGQLTGWIGTVGTTPTGGEAGCTSAVADEVTPGWCLGGSPKVSELIDTVSYGDIATDGANALFLLSTKKITRFNLSTGAQIGWIGKISTSPTGLVGAKAVSPRIQTQEMEASTIQGV